MLYMIWHWITSWLIGWGGIGAIVCVAAWLLWFFCPAMLLTYKKQLLQIAIAVTAFTFASTYFFTSGFNKGYSTAMHSIAAQDDKAKHDAKDANDEVQACFDSGGDWVAADNSCMRRSP